MSTAYCTASVISQEPSPYEMTADTIDCNQKTRHCVAKGNARITSGSGDGIKVLTAQTLTASMKEKGSKVAAQEIHAEGDVLLVAHDKRIRSDRASYTPDSQSATFDGNVQIHFGSHAFKGEHACVDLNQSNFSLKGSQKTPVSGLVYPKVLPENRRGT